MANPGVRNAWPEYFGQQSGKAYQGVSSDPALYGGKVRISKPSDPPPPVHGKPEDVWIYVDGNDKVVGIPKRGVWHPNRVDPGWSKLVGKSSDEATKTILSEELGAWVVEVEKGFKAKADDFVVYRVYLETDRAGFVTATPKFG